MQAVGHSQIFPKKLHEQAGLRYSYPVVGAMAEQTETQDKKDGLSLWITHLKFLFDFLFQCHKNFVVKKFGDRHIQSVAKFFECYDG